MERDCILGGMEENMKVIIIMIKNMDLVCTHGQMAEDTKENGNKENSNNNYKILSYFKAWTGKIYIT